MSLERFCRKPLVHVRPEQSVLEAAKEMTEGHVGAVVVTEAGHPLGILTDRDIVTRVVGPKLDPARTKVKNVMTPDPQVAKVSDEIDQVAYLMRSRGVRRLPIVDEEGKLAGAVSLDDLLVLFSAELGQTAAAVRANRGP